METQRRWFRGSTLAFMVVLLMPFLAPDVSVAVHLHSLKDRGFSLPNIFWVLFFVVCAAQIAIACYVSIGCEWILDASEKRHWFRLKLSTCMFLMLMASALMIFAAISNEARVRVEFS